MFFIGISIVEKISLPVTSVLLVLYTGSPPMYPTRYKGATSAFCWSRYPNLTGVAGTTSSVMVPTSRTERQGHIVPIKKKLILLEKLQWNHSPGFPRTSGWWWPVPDATEFRHAIISPNLAWPNTVLSTVPVDLFDGVERVCSTLFVFTWFKRVEKGIWII
jgi:hypothetical protein